MHINTAATVKIFSRFGSVLIFDVGFRLFQFGSVLIFDLGFRLFQFGSSKCILLVFRIQNMYS